MKKYSVENLVKVDSYIEEYYKEGEKLNKEYLINEISIEKLKTIVSDRDGDEELYLSYEITKDISLLLNENLKIPIIFDFDKFEYFLQRYGEYK
jgi:hypothetical protein